MCICGGHISCSMLMSRFFLLSYVLIILGPQNIEDEVQEQVQSLLDETVYAEHGMNLNLCFMHY